MVEETLYPMIFCDTTAYLDFYETREKGTLDLLKILARIQGSLFIPNQIECEVRRRKLKCVIDSLGDPAESMKHDPIPPVSLLPVHILSGAKNEEIQEWNDTRSRIRSESKELKSKLREHVKGIVNEVAQSKDPVSLAYECLFNETKHPTQKEYSRAQRRKTLGNPPGKASQPIGDQIIWEQLLSHSKVHTDRELWIVSHDSDYVVIYGHELYLNPFLLYELEHDIGLTSDRIRTFSSIAEMLKCYTTDIDPQVLEDIDTTSIEKAILEASRQRDAAKAFRDTGFVIIPLGGTEEQLEFGFMKDLKEYNLFYTNPLQEVLFCPRCMKSYKRLEAIGGGMLCPHCQSTEPYRLESDEERD